MKANRPSDRLSTALATLRNTSFATPETRRNEKRTKTLILQSLPLADKAVRKYTADRETTEHSLMRTILFKAAVEGIVQAAKRYVPSKKLPFSTLAFLSAREHVRKVFLEQFRRNEKNIRTPVFPDGGDEVA